MEKGELAELVRTHALRRGDFLLSSGRRSTYYLDLKQAYTRPEVMRGIVEEVLEVLGKVEADVLAGMELGAVPILAAASLKSGIPFAIVRKERKGHGAGRRIEGEIGGGRKVVLIEDVSTTGSTLAEVAHAVREAGGSCETAIAVVDRLEGAGERLQKINIHLIPLLTIKDLGL